MNGIVFIELTKYRDGQKIFIGLGQVQSIEADSRGTWIGLSYSGGTEDSKGIMVKEPLEEIRRLIIAARQTVDVAEPDWEGRFREATTWWVAQVRRLSELCSAEDDRRLVKELLDRAHEELVP